MSSARTITLGESAFDVRHAPSRDNTRGNVHPFQCPFRPRHVANLDDLDAPRNIYTTATRLRALWTVWFRGSSSLLGRTRKAPQCRAFTSSAGCGDVLLGRCGALVSAVRRVSWPPIPNALAPRSLEAREGRQRGAPGHTADRHATPPRFGPTPAGRAYGGFRCARNPCHEASPPSPRPPADPRPTAESPRLHASRGADAG